MKIWNNKKNTRRLYLFIALQFSMLFIMVLFVWISKLAINLNKVKTKNCNLKGVWDEIFNLYFIPWIKHIRAPNEHPKMVLQNFLNLRRCSITKFNFSHSPEYRTPGSEILLITNSIFKNFKRFIYNPCSHMKGLFYIIPLKGTINI